MNRGILFALGAYGLWGFLPIYWKFLQHVPSIEILAHRIVWSLVFLIAVLVITQNWAWIQLVRTDKRILLIYLGASVFLTINWGVYIWAVNAGFIVETSLGYFINPLVSVFLGVLFLHERLRPWQWVAIATAAAGVLYLTISYGQLPWISLSLAFSFGIYGLLKKQAPLSSLPGLSLETAFVTLPFLVYLLYLGSSGTGAFGRSDFATTVLLTASGVATAIPLLFFAAAAQRIKLSMIGILQYLAPTIQVLIGVFIYLEPFPQQRLVGFSMIWLALLIYMVESWQHQAHT